MQRTRTAEAAATGWASFPLPFHYASQATDVSQSLVVEIAHNFSNFVRR